MQSAHEAGLWTFKDVVLIFRELKIDKIDLDLSKLERDVSSVIITCHDFSW